MQNEPVDAAAKDSTVQLAHEIVDEVLASTVFVSRASRPPAPAKDILEQEGIVSASTQPVTNDLQKVAEPQPVIGSKKEGTRPFETLVSAYQLKSIHAFMDFPQGQSKEVNILLQNENGPCPLLALCMHTRDFYL